MIITTTAVVAFGADAVTSTQSQLDLQRSEKSMTQLNSRAAMVALGQSNAQQVVLPSSGSDNYFVNEQAGWMNLSYENTTSVETTTVFNETMGEVVYNSGEDSKMAYQGGGVWRSRGNGQSVMVSPPEFHYRDATLTLPLVTVSGDGPVRDQALITKNNSRQYFPNSTHNENFINPLRNGKVNVTVQSEYYQAWGKYFETRTEGQVEYDHAKQIVKITLTTPADSRVVSSATAATAGGTLKIDGNGARTDNYTSADGTGYTTGSTHGTVRTAGDVLVTGSGTLDGNVTAAGEVTISGSGSINGDVVEYGSGGCPSGYTGTCRQISSFQGASPVDSYVDNRYSETKSAGTDHGSITTSTTLTAGNHHVDHIELQSGETLTLDTSSGDVNISVKDYIHLDKSGGSSQGEIEVTGTNQVNIFLKGESTPVTRASRKRQLAIEGGAIETLSRPENSTQVWIYGKKDMNASVWQTPSGSGLTGVIYAPGGSAGEGQFYIKQGDLYGGVVMSYVSLEQFGAVHYDSALGNTRAVPRDENLITVTYLHASTNDVNVTSN